MKDCGCYYLVDVKQGSSDWLFMRKGRITNKISGGIYGSICENTDKAKDVIDGISPDGPYNVTVGATFVERENVCHKLRSFPGCENKKFVAVPPPVEALSTLDSCSYNPQIGAGLFFGRSAAHLVVGVEQDEDGYAHCIATHTFSMKDYKTVAAFAAIVVRECASRGKRVLIAGSPTIPTYNEAWITDGSVDKQFITVSPLELACKIEQLGEKGTDAITIIRKMTRSPVCLI